MADGGQEMLAQVADKGLNMVQSFGDKLADVIKNHGQQAVDFSLEVGRIAALDALLPGFICFFFALMFGTVNTWSYKKPWFDGKDAWGHPKVTWWPTVFFIGLAAMGVMLLTTAIKFSNVYAWVGLLHPEVFLAAKALNL